jgi:hypothetical protein
LISMFVIAVGLAVVTAILLVVFDVFSPSEASVPAAPGS